MTRLRIVRRDDIDEPFRGPFGELIYEMIGRLQALGGTTAHSFVHVLVPPEKRSRLHFHKISEETYFVLSGAGDIVVDGEAAVLRPGDACLIMPGQTHQIMNRGTDDLEFIAVSAPRGRPMTRTTPMRSEVRSRKCGVSPVGRVDSLRVPIIDFKLSSKTAPAIAASAASTTV